MTTPQIRVVRGLLWVIFPLVALWFLVYAQLPTASDVTATRVWELRSGILAFVQAVNRLPEDLSVLATSGVYTGSPTDGWGVGFNYYTNVDGLVVLTSYGKDGRQGGGGSDRDRVWVFRVRDAQGAWLSATDAVTLPVSTTNTFSVKPRHGQALE